MPTKKPSSKDSGLDLLKKDIAKIDNAIKQSTPNQTTDTNIDLSTTPQASLSDLENLDTDINLNDAESPEENLNSTLSLTQLGSIYTLNRINSSIKSAESYIDDAILMYPNSKELVKLKVQVSDIQDKFILLSNNIDKYIDKLDVIIELYKDYVVTLSKYLNEKYKLT
jgi:Mg2+ and Co2+ transporter CorA